MLLAYHRTRVEEREVEELLASGRGGVSALDLVRAARHLGLEAEGVEVSTGGAGEIPPPAILHWQGSHFVVLEGRTAGGFQIVDPESGRRIVPETTFERLFSGVAIVAEGRRGGRGAGGGRPTESAGLRRAAPALAASLGLTALELLVCYLVSLGAERIYGGSQRAGLGGGAWWVGILVVYAALAFLRSSLVAGVRRRTRRRLVGELSRFLARAGHRALSGVSWRERELRLRSPFSEADAEAQRLRIAIAAVELSLVLAVVIWLEPLAAAATVVLLLVHTGLEGVRRPLPSTAGGPLGGAGGRVEHLLSHRIDLVGVAYDPRPALDDSASAARTRDRREAAMERREALRQTAGQLADLAGPLALLLLVLALAARKALGGGEVVLVLLVSLLGLCRGRHLTQLAWHHHRRRTPGKWWPRTPPADALDQRREAPGADAGVDVAISLRDVSFRYDPQAPEVLKGIDLDVRDGELLLVLGAPASGKSTLAGLLLGFLEPSGGIASVAGARPGGREAAASRAGLLDDMTLLEGTIRSNLTLGAPDLDEDALLAVCGTALLDREIRSLPLGLDTPVSQGGASLSVSQRRRLLVARAIAVRPGVLVLDDPFRSLDRQSGDELAANIADVGTTTIVVSSDPAPASRYAHRVLRLRDGRLEEAGSESAGPARANLAHRPT